MPWGCRHRGPPKVLLRVWVEQVDKENMERVLEMTGETLSSFTRTALRIHTLRQLSGIKRLGKAYDRMVDVERAEDDARKEGVGGVHETRGARIVDSGSEEG